jgi:hypothetical protein
MRAEYLDKNGQKAIGAQLQALRLAGVAPASLSLRARGTVLVDSRSGHRTICSDVAAGGDLDKIRELPPRANSDYVPKIAAALELIHGVLGRHEQVMLFSAFKEPLAILRNRLRDAGVRHEVLSGDCSQAQRARVMAVFKQGRAARDESIPIILASVESMAEGHSCPGVSNAIPISYSWAMDKFRQAIDRIYRLNSVKDVNVWSVLCEQTIDPKLESNIRDKGDASDLVLDGKLMGEPFHEENFFELLKYARKNFDPAANVIDDEVLHEAWPDLRARLHSAQSAWNLQPRGKRVSEVCAPPPMAIPAAVAILNLDAAKPRLTFLASLAARLSEIRAAAPIIEQKPSPAPPSIASGERREPVAIAPEPFRTPIFPPVVRTAASRLARIRAMLG